MKSRKSSGLHQPAAYLPFILIISLGAFLRFFRVGDQLILDDEWHALNVVQDQGYSWIFSHLGHADHSIPLSLLYEFFSHTIGLSELSMRMPSLLAGIVAIALLPRLMRTWLRPGEALMMAALIAISPFLTNYSRIARPYSILFLLSGASVILAWLWWKNQDRACGVAWILCAVLAAWLNPVTLAVTTAPFLWFFTGAFTKAIAGNFQVARRVLIPGVAIALGASLLLYIPFNNDFASLVVKSGVHQANAGTFLVAASLFSGSKFLLLIVLMTLTAISGWLTLYGRDRQFSLYVLVICISSTTAVLLTGAEWISQGLVLARYLIGLLVLYLALIAIGLANMGEKSLSFFSLSKTHLKWLAPVFLLALFLSGPLPVADAGTNQFMHHMSLQFDYDPGRNPINRALDPITGEAFYHEIAALNPEGDAVVVEAPWFLESNWNAIGKYQALHGQAVKAGFIGGVCAGSLYGELKQSVEGLDFKNFVHLNELLNGTEKANYLVFRTRFPGGTRSIDFNPALCEAAIRNVFGEPWRKTDSAMVFSLSGDP